MCKNQDFELHYIKCAEVGGSETRTVLEEIRKGRLRAERAVIKNRLKASGGFSWVLT